MHGFLLAWLPALWVASHPSALHAPADGWTELPIPSISRPSLPDAAPEPTLATGSHLLLEASKRGAASPRTSFHLPLMGLMQLLEDDARRQGTDLRCLRIAPPLLARGSDAALERARFVLLDLDRAGDAQSFRLALDLRPAGGEGMALDSLTREVELRSGESVRLGVRETRAFLATFDVDVATGIGTADPRVGRILTGPIADVRAWRSPIDAALFVVGTLDLSELTELELVDTGSNDLGQLERPRVGAAQVRFSGLVRSGESLLVEVRGAPLTEPDWTLTLRAEVPPEETGSWRVADLAWLEFEPPGPGELGAASPGAGLDAPHPHDLVSGRPQPLSSSILWGELEASLPNRMTDRPLFAVAPGLLVAPTAEELVWRELVRLVSAATRARSATRTVRMTKDGISVRFPTAEGMPFRVLVGTERTALTDFDTELAAEYWMAAPDVERVFDGWSVGGRLAGDELYGSWWVSASGADRVLSRKETLHGRLDLTQRELETGRVRIAADGGEHDLGPFRAALEDGGNR